MAKGGLLSKLVVGLLAGALSFLPTSVDASQDLLYVSNHIDKQGESTGKYSELRMGRRDVATEGFEIYDRDYSYPGPEEGKWSPKAFTEVEGHDLSQDYRGPNSLTDYNFNIGVIIQDGQDIVGSNQLGVKVFDTPALDYIPTNEHWTISYDYDPTYFVPGAGPRTDRKNLRDLCPIANIVNYWNAGVNIDVPFADADVNGEIVFGRGIFHKEKNQLTSTSTPEGTNSIAGSEVLDYGSDITIDLNANDGSYIDYYSVGRTDNVGNYTVTTNDFPGTDVTSTNVTLENLVGSNALHVVYTQDEPTQYTVTVNSEVDGLTDVGNPTGAGTYSESSVVTSTVPDVVTNPTNSSIRYINEGYDLGGGI